MKLESLYQDGDTVYIIRETPEHKKSSYYKIERALVTGVLVKSKNKVLYQLHGYTDFVEESELYEDATKCIDALIPLLLKNVNN